MKKVVCFIDSLGPGGAQRQIVGLAIALSKEKYVVKVATYHDIPFYKKELDSMNVESVLVPFAKTSLIRVFSSIHFFRKEKPDCIIAFLETPSIVAVFTSFFLNKTKIIVSERNTSQRLTFYERVRFFIFRKADIIVPNAYSQEQFIKVHFPELTHHITTITNYTDLNRFVFVPHKRNRVPIILVVASIWKPKNTIGLIRAVSLLKKQNKAVMVKWFGKDSSCNDYYNMCCKAIDALGIKDQFALYDKTDHIEEEYAAADFFCLPSFYEGTPNVICEAMASGLPILCSNVCDNPRYVIPNHNGYLFNPESVASIADTLERVLTISDYEYEVFCKNSRRKAEDSFSIKSYVSKYIELIEQ